MIEAYTDASFDKERGIAGIGIVIIDGHKRKDFALFVPCRTPNAGELFAIHLASILTHGQATIYTDSQTAYQYVINGVGEKKRNREQYLNHLECKYWAYQIKKSEGVSVVKVKGHSRQYDKNAANNMVADALAFLGRSKGEAWENVKEDINITPIAEDVYVSKPEPCVETDACLEEVDDKNCEQKTTSGKKSKSKKRRYYFEMLSRNSRKRR